MSINYDPRFCMLNPVSLLTTIDAIVPLSSTNLNIEKNSKKAHPRSTFTENEDKLLKNLVKKYGTYDWQLIAKHLPGRNQRQCRDRWKNYLSPEIVNGPWTKEEEKLLISKFEVFGPCWKKIASFFPTRTDINIKSRWNMMQRRIQKEDLQIKKEILIQKYGEKVVSASPATNLNSFPILLPPNIADKQLVQQIRKNIKQLSFGKNPNPSKKKNDIVFTPIPSKPNRKDQPSINSSPLPLLSEIVPNEKNFIKEDIFDSNSNDCLNFMLMKEELNGVFDSWF